MQSTRKDRRQRLLIGVVLSLLTLTLAACSAGSSSGGPNFSLGLAGSTADHPANPPAIASTGPDKTYAFVYDNQIWLRQSGQPAATQLTHIPLSNGATIKWGPLVWSPSGQYIAFVIVQDNVTGTTPETTGPIYYVDTNDPNHTVFATAGSGSIYGHTYTWYGDNMLFYSTGGGIMMYALQDGNGNADPRVWSLVVPYALQSSYQSTIYSGSGVGYGDLSVTNNGYLLYTQIHFDSFGSSNATGHASLWEVNMQGFSSSPQTPETLVGELPFESPGGSNNPTAQIADLGTVYTSSNGELVAGAWQITSGSHVLITQHINGVDTKSATVTSNFCALTGDPNAGYGGCVSILKAAQKQPTDSHPELSLSGNGTRVAFTANGLYLQNTDGSGAAQAPNVGWFTPPAWSPDGGVVAVTQLTGSPTDANRVTRYQTNLLTFASGSSTGATLISGAQDLSWKP